MNKISPYQVSILTKRSYFFKALTEKKMYHKNLSPITSKPFRLQNFRLTCFIAQGGERPLKTLNSFQ